jgi:hypothetical protein
MKMTARSDGIRSVLVGLACWGLATTLPAQQTLLQPKEVGQLTSVALDSVLPVGLRLSGVTVSNRKVLFDFARTSSAFGRDVPDSTAARDFDLKRPLRLASRDVLVGCDRSRSSACQNMGWQVYVWVEPVSLSPSSATVRVHARWPDRGSEAFAEGTAPVGRAGLVGFFTEISLARSRSGQWEYVRRGMSVAID